MARKIIVVTAAYGNDHVKSLGGQAAVLPFIANAGADGVEIRNRTDAWRSSGSAKHGNDPPRGACRAVFRGAARRHAHHFHSFFLKSTGSAA
mgnify:CR=1 FL=1